MDSAPGPASAWPQQETSLFSSAVFVSGVLLAPAEVPAVAAAVAAVATTMVAAVAELVVLDVVAIAAGAAPALLEPWYSQFRRPSCWRRGHHLSPEPTYREQFRVPGQVVSLQCRPRTPAELYRRMLGPLGECPPLPDLEL